MKLKITFFLIIFLNCFFCEFQANFFGNFYTEHPQFVKTVGVMMGVCIIPGLCAKAKYGQSCTLSAAIYLIPTAYFETDERKRTAKDTIGQFFGLLPIIYILSRSYDGKLNSTETILSVLSTFVIRMSIG